MAKYLQIEGKSGRVFEYSKTAQEGFEEYKSSTGNTSYRNYYNTGVYGTLLNVSIRDSKIGEQLQVSVKNGNEYINLQFPLYTERGGIDNRYAESLIRFLPSLEKGKGYRFYPYAIEQEGTTYMNHGISVIESPNPETEEKGNKVEPYLEYSKDPKGDKQIPNLTWKEVAGKNRPSAVSQEAKDEFLFGFLKEAVDGHLKYEGGSSNSTQESTPTPKQEESKGQEAPVIDGADEYDDLPF
jgi:hypothetical protein